MGAPTLRTEDGYVFRDLDKNGRLDPYEDPRRPLEERVEDLLSRMTIEEKAGMLFHTMAALSPGDALGESAAEMITKQRMSHFNIYGEVDARTIAEWHNEVQALAEDTRLGIPVTISSDPRHSFSHSPVTSLHAGSFSLWPEPIGLAAIGDPEVVREFGDIARQEYLAVGIRVALHPMADLATEPRWARISGTFGEDAHLAARLVAAYIRGFQGETLGPESVACMTKHFPGGGPQKDGEDPHFSYGREQIYPGDNFEYHLIPFEAAFEAGTAQIMPYYGMPVGLPFEEVGFGFNRDVITGLLRKRYGFDGVVCTDWALLTSRDLGPAGTIEAKAWGVEHLSLEERTAKALGAGVDQFGGEACPEVVVGLVRSGRIGEDRIDRSVRRLLRDKFRLGLFDDPYVDPDQAERTCGNERFRAAGDLAQRRSIVLLKNGDISGGKVLPLRGSPRMYLENVSPEAAAEYGEVASDLGDADVAILRLSTPYEPREGLMERFFHAGRLDFDEEELGRILRVADRVPTVVDVFMDRPAVMPEIAARSAALLANFGASDAALLDVVFGRFRPSGRLPFELPSSMEAVRRQKPDVPYDSENPLFPFGHGLSY